ncbi:MAG: response regulator [Alphaproteobacteria bacterium]|nr:response regulator [Alphaproteobacteria bacterium]
MREEETALAGLRILIVDDNDKFLKLVSSMLRRLRVGQVYTAPDGKYALKLLYDAGDVSPINLIMCDLCMPHLDGLQLLRQTRFMQPAYPFLMVTGSTDEQTVLEAKAAGVSGFLAKPFTLEELKSKLSVVMQAMTDGGAPNTLNWIDNG